MEKMTGTFGRIGKLAIRLAAVFALALLLAGAVAPHVGATENNGPAMDKGAFKKGCEAGGGSYVENASDNSFGCNMQGGSIKCTSTTSPCTFTSNSVSTGGQGGRVKVVKISSAGAMQMVQLPPTPEPTVEPTYVAVAHTTASVKSTSATAP